MAVLAAGDALADSGIEDKAKRNIGMIVATAFGPHVTTFGFLDDILDHGDAAVSPTTFSNSVHNAAASYITTVPGHHRSDADDHAVPLFLSDGPATCA